MSVLQRWKQRARELKTEVAALMLALHDPRVPRSAKVLAACVVAYALSPIDLIPDFIPVLGYLDDLVLVPLGIHLVLRLIPRDVMEDCRRRAREQGVERRANWFAGALILLLWALSLALLVRWWLSR